jgi:signal peptidase I
MAKSLEQIRAETKSSAKTAPKPSDKTRLQSEKQRNAVKLGASNSTPPNGEPQTFVDYAVSLLRTIGGAFLMVMLLNGVLIASFVVPTGSMEATVMTGDFLFVNKFVYGPSTPQMIPVLNVPLPYYRFPGLRQPEKGDVIVFIFPGNREEVKPQEFQYYLKRCVATAGDTLIVRNKQVIVNGAIQALAPDARLSTFTSEADDYLRTFPIGANFTRDNYGPIRIPKKGDVVQLSPENLAQWEVFIGREGHAVTTDNGSMFIDGKASPSYTVERNYCFGMGDNRDNSLDSRYWGFIPMQDVVGTPLIVYWSWETNLPHLAEKFATIRWNRVGRAIK